MALLTQSRTICTQQPRPFPGIPFFMKKTLGSLMLFSLLSLPAFADRYVPLARCEGGRVVLDRVVSGNPSADAYQVVIHDADFANRVYRSLNSQGMPGFLMRIYDQGKTLVILVKTLGRPGFFSPGAQIAGSELRVAESHTEDGAIQRNPSYVFRGCIREPSI
jgi:hypothetical protein